MGSLHVPHEPGVAPSDLLVLVACGIGGGQVEDVELAHLDVVSLLLDDCLQEVLAQLLHDPHDLLLVQLGQQLPLHLKLSLHRPLVLEFLHRVHAQREVFNVRNVIDDLVKLLQAFLFFLQKLLFLVNLRQV